MSPKQLQEAHKDNGADKNADIVYLDQSTIDHEKAKEKVMTIDEIVN